MGAVKCTQSPAGPKENEPPGGGLHMHLMYMFCAVLMFVACMTQLFVLLDVLVHFYSFSRR